MREVSAAQGPIPVGAMDPGAPCPRRVCASRPARINKFDRPASVLPFAAGTRALLRPPQLLRVVEPANPTRTPLLAPVGSPWLPLASVGHQVGRVDSQPAEQQLYLTFPRRCSVWLIPLRDPPEGFLSLWTRSEPEAWEKVWCIFRNHRRSSFPRDCRDRDTRQCSTALGRAACCSS